MIYEKMNKRTPNNQYSSEVEDITENSENCEHLFMPLDASGEYFACEYCGLVVPKDKLK